jgi:hypothetical protein
MEARRAQERTVASASCQGACSPCRGARGTFSRVEAEARKGEIATLAGTSGNLA